jgi:hypothetical protein
MPEEIKAGFYPEFEQGWRRAELVGRVLMLVVVGATLGGLLGGGPVSLWTRKATNGLLEVEYAPVVRFGTPTGLTIRVAAAPGQDRVAVTLPGSIVQRYGLQSIYPQPIESQAGPDRSMRLVFPVQPGAQMAVIQVGGMPAGGGLMRLSARLDGGARTAWSQLVLP